MAVFSGHTWYLSPPPVMNFSQVGALFCTENAKFVVCFRRKGGQKYILHTCWVGDEDDEMSYIYIEKHSSKMSYLFSDFFTVWIVLITVFSSWHPQYICCTCLKTMYFAKVINAHLPNVRVPKLILSLSDIGHSCPTSCFHYFVSCVGYSRHKKGNCFQEFL